MYKTREEWLASLVNELRPVFASVSFPLPEKIRVTCGFPSSKAKALHRAIGEHWSPKASNDDHHEILISPVVDDVVEVAAILVHELAHAATDGDGHGRNFTQCVRALWLEGKPTVTVAGSTFKQMTKDILDGLGPYPHAALNVRAGRKPQPTRMLKASCPCCGYTVRLTAKWTVLGLPICPVDNVQFTI